jgi:glycosyltransferase involved in cell wall biosynthesis
MPNHGVFVYNRLNAMARDANITVINPLPWSPFHYCFKRYKGLRGIPAQREQGRLSIHHPRFFSIPGALKEVEQHTFARCVSRLATELNPKGTSFDCIDVHWPYPDLPVALALAKKWGIPCNITLRGMEAFYLDEKDKRPAIIKQALSQVDGVISLSEEMAETAHALADTKSKTTLIRNGADTQKFQHQPMSEARASLGLPPEGLVFLSVGALIERKGYQNVISALSQLSIAGKLPSHWRYYIIGSAGLEGNCEQTLRNQIKTLALEEHVILQGSVNNPLLPIWYNAADVFCLSSFGEGSPNVLTEALSCGCPAIATRVGAVPDIMSSVPDLGVMVDVGQTEDWCEAIPALLSKTTSRALRAQALAPYDWAWCGDKALSALKGLCLRG